MLSSGSNDDIEWAPGPQNPFCRTALQPSQKPRTSRGADDQEPRLFTEREFDKCSGDIASLGAQKPAAERGHEIRKPARGVAAVL